MAPSTRSGSLAQNTSTANANIEPIQNVDPPANQEAVVIACEAVVDRYKAKDINKVQALIDLFNAIPGGAESTDVFKNAYTAFVGMLDAHDEREDRSQAIGQSTQAHGATGVGDQPTPGEEGSGTQGREAGNNEREEMQTQAFEFDALLRASRDALRKRARDFFDDELDQEGIERGEANPNMPDPDSLPWANQVINTAQYDPSLIKTSEILTRIGSNYKGHLKALRTGLGRPPFPKSQWEKILQGEAVDIDVVFSHINTDIVEHRHAERWGTAKIEFDSAPTAPSKRVRTASDWASAWYAITRATQFVFEHRGEELTRYGTYIQSLFQAIPSRPDLIISLDRGIRIRHADTRDFLLTDTSAYGDLHYKFIVHPTPSVRAAPSQSNSTNGRRKEREVCRNWNDDRCKNQSCSRIHKCLTCNGDHRKSDCSRKEK
jgi:hypothetical protein